MNLKEKRRKETYKQKNCQNPSADQLKMYLFSPSIHTIKTVTLTWNYIWPKSRIIIKQELAYQVVDGRHLLANSLLSFTFPGMLMDGIKNHIRFTSVDSLLASLWQHRHRCYLILLFDSRQTTPKSNALHLPSRRASSATSQEENQFQHQGQNQAIHS